MADKKKKVSSFPQLVLVGCLAKSKYVFRGKVECRPVHPLFCFCGMTRPNMLQTKYSSKIFSLTYKKCMFKVK